MTRLISSINCILQYKTVLQAHSGFDSVLGAAGGNRCWLVVAPWWQTQEHLTRLILALHSSMSVPPMRGHLPCRETFAWIQKCPLKAGTTACIYETVNSVYVYTRRVSILWLTITASIDLIAFQSRLNKKYK